MIPTEGVMGKPMALFALPLGIKSTKKGLNGGTHLLA